MKLLYSILLIIGIACGFIYYAFEHNWILIRIPIHALPELSYTQTKKAVPLYTWHSGQWHQENKEIIWSPLPSQTLTNLINAWLDVVQEDCPPHQKIMLQSVALSYNEQTVYLSFDKLPFHPQASTLEKMFWIESLLKTMRSTSLAYIEVHILVNHTIVQDTHLNLEKAWPLKGFNIVATS